MAKGRIISTYVALDPDLNALSIESTLAYLMCIPHLDRDALIDGRPTVLWAKACPLRPELLDKFPRFIHEWEQRARRVQEIDDALAIITEWKDTLKQLANEPNGFAEPIGFAEPQQETLFPGGVHADTRTRRRPTY